MRMPRFVLLEHTGHPDDPAGRHYDLLLEDGAACRTWRLAAIPAADAAPVATAELPPHRLVWLERLEGEVSGGRGFARRIDAGTYAPAIPPGASPATDGHLLVHLHGRVLAGRLRLEPGPSGSAVLTVA
jgi:hypothetical protein